jgi:hypothetical protein
MKSNASRVDEKEFVFDFIQTFLALWHLLPKYDLGNSRKHTTDMHGHPNAQSLRWNLVGRAHL